WSVVTCGRQSKSSIKWQLEYSLHQSFAKTSFSDNQTSAVILDSTGDDFRCRRCVAINQDHEWNTRGIRTARFVDNRVTVFSSSLHGYNNLSTWKKLTRHVNRLVE